MKLMISVKVVVLLFLLAGCTVKLEKDISGETITINTHDSSLCTIDIGCSDEDMEIPDNPGNISRSNEITR